MATVIATIEWLTLITVKRYATQFSFTHGEVFLPLTANKVSTPNDKLEAIS